MQLTNPESINPEVLKKIITNKAGSIEIIGEGHGLILVVKYTEFDSITGKPGNEIVVNVSGFELIRHIQNVKANLDFYMNVFMLWGSMDVITELGTKVEQAQKDADAAAAKMAADAAANTAELALREQEALAQQEEDLKSFEANKL